MRAPLTQTGRCSTLLPRQTCRDDVKWGLGGGMSPDMSRKMCYLRSSPVLCLSSGWAKDVTS
jgi:hypothetical protein